MVYDEKSIINLILFFSIGIVGKRAFPLPLDLFKIFSLLLVFCSLSMIKLGVNFVYFPLQGVSELPGSVVWCLSLILGSF